MDIFNVLNMIGGLSLFLYGMSMMRNELSKMAGGKVKISVGKIDGQTALTVKDNGIGIPTSEQQRIFERFYRVDKSRSKATGGTGLGLAIVKHIAEIHDAKITVDSALGVGTTIYVLF